MIDRTEEHITGGLNYEGLARCLALHYCCCGTSSCENCCIIVLAALVAVKIVVITGRNYCEKFCSCNYEKCCQLEIIVKSFVVATRGDCEKGS